MDAARVTEERRLELERASQKCGIRAHRHHGGRGVRKIGDCDDDVSVHVIQPARNERAPGAADTESPVRHRFSSSLAPFFGRPSRCRTASPPRRRPQHKKRGDTTARKGRAVQWEKRPEESHSLILSLHPKEANQTEQVSDIRDLAPFWCGFVVRPRSLLRSRFPFI